MSDYYQGYKLDDVIAEWMLSTRDKTILDCAIWIVENRTSIRQCSKEMTISKSTIHRCIHEELPHLSYELYKCCIKQLVINKKKYSR